MEAAAAHTSPVSMVMRINLVTLPFVASLHVDFLAALNYVALLENRDSFDHRQRTYKVAHADSN
jgi:hypothetical protein